MLNFDALRARRYAMSVTLSEHEERNAACKLMISLEKWKDTQNCFCELSLIMRDAKSSATICPRALKHVFISPER